MKITELSPADDLDGGEPVMLVQAEDNLRTTTRHIGDSILSRNPIDIGRYAYGNSEQSIAIGYQAVSLALIGSPIAIGAYARVVGDQSIGVGYDAYTVDNKNIAIGISTYTNTPDAIALGSYSRTIGNYGLTLGFNGRASNGVSIGVYTSGAITSTDCIAIGYHVSSAVATSGTGIGSQSSVGSSDAVAIGFQTHAFHAGVSIGYAAGNTEYGAFNISIGAEAVGFGDAAVAIGVSLAAGPASVSIGHSRTTNIMAVAIGSSYVSGFQAFGLGLYNFAWPNDSRAIGNFAVANYPNSTLLGSSALDIAGGSLTVRGCGPDSLFYPALHFQKLYGDTVAPSDAIVQFNIGDTTVTFSGPYDYDGFIFRIIQPATTDAVTQIEYGDHLTIFLGTDGDGNADPLKNTIANIAALFPVGGFMFAYDMHGGTDDIFSTEFTATFSVSVPGTPVLALTTDGGSPFFNNIVGLHFGSVGRLVGRVTAAEVGLFASDGDAAAFILAPISVYRQDDGSYVFVGTPEFTMENNTAGAVDWPLPTLTIDLNGLLAVTVNNYVADLNWMAHFTLETSQ